MSTIENLASAIERGEKAEALSFLQQALDEGIDPQLILSGLVAAMDAVGERFARREMFIPEMLMSARAMTACTDTLRPLMVDSDGAQSTGKAVIATVRGDMHDIGKSLVRMLLEAKGFEVKDLGVNVSADTFVEYLQSHKDCGYVLLSALLTSSMPAMRETVAAIEAAGLQSRVKIFVGGAPVTSAFAKEIGADFYTPDAGTCAAKAVEVASIA